MAGIAIEYNGFQGSLPEVLAHVSADGGAVASIFWNVNDDNAFTCARIGELVTTVDLYDADEVDVSEEVRALSESAAG